VAGPAAATLGLEDPAATVPLADVGKTVAAAGVLPGIAEVAATGTPAVLKGMPGSAATAGRRLANYSPANYVG